MALFTVNYNAAYGYLYDFKAEAWEVKADNYIQTNQTTVYVYVYMRRNKLSSQSAYNGYGTEWGITIDGDKKTGTTKWDTRNSVDWIWLGQHSKTITHNSDGSKEIYISAYHIGNSATGSSKMGEASGGANFVLTKIPRASSILANDANIESATTINISRADNSFTHTITYSFYDLTGTITTKTANASVGWTIPSSFYAKIPNSKTGVVTLTCTTYSGDSAIGTSTTTFTVTASEIKCKPTITATLIDANSTTVALTGSNAKLVKYKSTAKVTPTATAKNSATIKTITVNGTTVSGSYIQFTNVQSTTFKVVVTDSRGYSDETTLKPTIVNYIPLTLTAEFYRTAATSSTVKVKYSGNYFNASFGSVSNVLTITWKYRKKGATSWTNGGTLTPTKSGNTYSGDVSLGTTFDYQTAYDFIIYSSDKVSSLNSQQPVKKGEPIYDWGVDKNGANYLNVNGGLYVKNQAILDLVYPVGAIYMSVNSTNPGTLFGGTWVAWGTGRVPVGVDTSQTEFATVEKTGGNKTVTLTVDQMPKHNHGQDSHQHQINEVNGDNNIIASGGYNNNGNQWGANFIYGGQPGAWGFTNVSNFYTRWAQPYIWEAGGGGAHNNLQPYITCYMWKRTK
jgi:microcystin-dependent protein